MPKLVRYVSPFGSPASMAQAQAERHLAEDTKLWNLCEEVGLLDERMLRIGPPRLDDPQFHLTDLPEWVEPGEDRFETIRSLVRRAEQWTRERGGQYVVVEREGRLATFLRSLVISGDEVLWETR